MLWFPFAIAAFVMGIVLAILGVPVFIAGVRARADQTVFWGSLLIGASVVCFYFASSMMAMID